MKNTKRRMEIVSFFDHTGISAHLGKMAEKGWMIEKITSFGWRYRRIEPKHIKFAISYYPKASEFDPEPSEEQKEFHDFCEHTGWKLACTSAQLQIFYNENENPVPIETESVLEVQTIHASVKKGMLVPYILLMIVAVVQGGLFVSRLLGDPIGLLASPSTLVSGIAVICLALLCAVELGCYYKWYGKAKIAAEQGEFLETPSTARFQKAVLIVLGIVMLYWGFSYLVNGPIMRRWISIIMMLYVPLLIVIVNGTKEFLKKKKVSRKVNFIITMLVDLFFAFALMGMITFGVLKASNMGLFAEKGEDTYEYGGITWILHEDELPLVLEDLTEGDFNGYIRERRGDSSILLSQLELFQCPRMDVENHGDLPRLEYTIVAIHLPALYELCRNEMMNEREYIGKVRRNQYQEADAEAWGANEAYRLYDLEYGVENTWLLCYEEQIVEIQFDWEPTKEQMAIVNRKLNGLKMSDE